MELGKKGINTQIEHCYTASENIYVLKLPKRLLNETDISVIESVVAESSSKAAEFPCNNIPTLAIELSIA